MLLFYLKGNSTEESLTDRNMTVVCVLLLYILVKLIPGYKLFYILCLDLYK